MIVIKVLLWPGGDESRERELGRTYVYNVATSFGGAIGSYGVRVMRRGVKTEYTRGVYEGKERVTRCAEVKDHKRHQANVWNLVYKALAAAFPEYVKEKSREKVPT